MADNSSNGGLRTALAAGLLVTTYTSIEIDDVARAIEWRALGELQTEFPGQLLDSAIRNFNKRLPQDIRHVGEADLLDLL